MNEILMYIFFIIAFIGLCFCGNQYINRENLNNYYQYQINYEYYDDLEY